MVLQVLEALMMTCEVQELMRCCFRCWGPHLRAEAVVTRSTRTKTAKPLTRGMSMRRTGREGQRACLFGPGILMVQLFQHFR